MSWIIPAVVLAVIVGFAAGYLCGRCYQDGELIVQCREQQRRGDYWFSKYQRAISDYSFADED